MLKSPMPTSVAPRVLDRAGGGKITDDARPQDPSIRRAGAVCAIPPYTWCMATTDKKAPGPAHAAKVKVVDSKKAMATLDKIRKRDSELLKRLSR